MYSIKDKYKDKDKDCQNVYLPGVGMLDGGLCISLDWIVGRPVNVICIVHSVSLYHCIDHSSHRMIGPPPCQTSCYRHACVKILGSDKDKDNVRQRTKSGLFHTRFWKLVIKSN